MKCTPSLAGVTLSLLLGACANEDEPCRGTAFAPSQTAVQICIDRNGNSACEPEEAIASADKAGAFELAECSAANQPIVADGVMPMVGLTAPQTQVSPFTTFVRRYASRHSLSDADALAQVLSRFGAATSDAAWRRNFDYFAAVLYQEIARRTRDPEPNAAPERIWAKWYELLDQHGSSYLRREQSAVVLAPATQALDAGVDKGSVAGGLSSTVADVAGMPASLVRFIEPGMVLGVGLDALSGRTLPNAQCLNWPGVVVQREIERDETHLSYFIADNLSELEQEFGISASFSLDTSTLEVSLEASFLAGLAQHEDSIYIVLELEREFADYSMVPEFPANATVFDAFVNDYDKFRAWCGDMFLQTLTSGVQYRAILEVKARNHQERLEIAAAVHGNYKPLDLDFLGSFALMLERLGQTYGYSIYTTSRGAAGSSVPLGNWSAMNTTVSPNELVEDIQSFLVAADQARALDQSPTQFPLKARFVNYSEIGGRVAGSGIVDENRALVKAYRDAYGNLEGIAYEIRDILIDSQNYEMKEGDEIALRDLQDRIQVHQAILRSATLQCEERGATRCERLNEEFHSNLERYRVGLPGLKPILAASCQELRARVPSAREDGRQLLYIGNRRDAPFWAYCKGMTETTSSAETYLVLERTSPNTPVADLRAQGPNYNFARAFWRATGASGSSGEVEASGAAEPVAWGDAMPASDVRVVQTAYSLLRVDPFPDGLVVAAMQAFGMTTVSDCTASYCPSFVPYATASSCDQLSDTEINAEGMGTLTLPLLAQIDLSGTPFFVSPVVEFVETMPVEVVGEPASCAEALESARLRGGSLLTIGNAADNQTYATILQQNRLLDSWIKLTPSQEAIGVYGWGNTRENPDYRSWRDSTRRCQTIEDAKSLCVTLNSDGTWLEVEANRKRPYLVEYGKLASEVEYLQSRQVVKIRGRERWGGCNGLRPTPGLVLLHDRTLAAIAS